MCWIDGVEIDERIVCFMCMLLHIVFQSVFQRYLAACILLPVCLFDCVCLCELKQARVLAQAQQVQQAQAQAQLAGQVREQHCNTVKSLCMPFRVSSSFMRPVTSIAYRG